MDIHSNFWFDFKSDDEIDHIRLASIRRSIGNFVNILTCQRIPVRFYSNDRGLSFTDGKSVTISADIKMENFDATVGTALHEGAHIVYSDFDLLKQLGSMMPQRLFAQANKKNISINALKDCVKDCWNYVEDRFIDKTVFDSAPGYREYYRAMYRQHWHSDAITEVIASVAYRDESIESYMYRIINLTNPSTDLKALNGLLEIAKMIGFSDITRLQKPIDRFRLAFNIVEVILNNVVENPKPKKTKDDYSTIPGAEPQEGAKPFPSKYKDMEDEDENNSSTCGKNNEEEVDDILGEAFSGDIFGGIDNQIEQADNSAEKSKDSEDGAKVDNVGKRTLKRAKRDFEDQKKFLNGEIEKSPLSEEDENQIKYIEESGTEYVPVGFDSYGIIKKMNCVVVKKMTREVMNLNTFPLSDTFSKLYSDDTPTRRAVNDGLRMGTILGKRLKVRGESRSTKYTRQRRGRIDKRLISSLGYSVENVFSHVEIDTYKDAKIHISVDASYSMTGDKWNKTMTSVVAIAKAASMINNLDVVISFRTSTESVPYIVKAYDSTEDSIVKVKSLFPDLRPRGGTPEGLAFEAIMDMISPSNSEFDSYFLNFSDGEPYFHGPGFVYGSDSATRHTKQQVNRIRAKGVEVLSYFISGRDEGLISNFKTMYGKDAQNVDVTNVQSVALTMNKKFLTKQVA